MHRCVHNGKAWRFVAALLFIFSLDVHAQSGIQTDVPALKGVYRNDFTIGCLLSYPHVGFSTDPPVPGQSSVVAPQGGYLIQFHMNSMSPGNNMKPQNTVDIGASAAAYNAATTQSERDSINIHPVVRFNGNMIAQLNWAQRQGFTFRGHTLVWHNQTPGTAFFREGYAGNGTRLTPETMTKRMDYYIKEIIRLLHERWPGMLSAMDVVNEAVDDGGNNRTTNNEWWSTYGDNSYIAKAFEITRKWTAAYGETQVKLYYNDYNTHLPAKANGIVNLLTPIFQAGHLDGIGMQDHDQVSSPAAEQWIASYNKFNPVCTEMAVTELDVNPGNSSSSAQANQYAQLFKCFVERSYKSGRGKIINVSKDGLNDQYAFVANASLWNSQFQCKPSFYAVVEVGMNYHALDSLISYSRLLKEHEYSSNAWSDFSAVLAFATTARDRNYSASVSAVEGLKGAKDTLQSALNALLGIAVRVDDARGAPTEFSLGQNFPNPFNPATRITYSLPQRIFVSLKVYNLLGTEVATLVEGIRQAGTYEAMFDGRGLSSGVYLYRMHANNFVRTKKFLLLK